MTWFSLPPSDTVCFLFVPCSRLDGVRLVSTIDDMAVELSFFFSSCFHRQIFESSIDHVIRNVQYDWSVCLIGTCTYNYFDFIRSAAHMAYQRYGVEPVSVSQEQHVEPPYCPHGER